MEFDLIKNVTIHICLSTYNAGNYLVEQLDSILNQTVKNWVCLIRDDGSSDDTIHIIKKYCNLDPRFILINPQDSQNLGVHRSFYELVKYQTADYYFFCDQDDVWLEDKLQVFLRAASDNLTVPEMVYSSWTTVDDHLEKIKENNPITVIEEEIAFNQINGMSMMLNRALADLWKYRDLGSHDSFVAVLAYAVGKVTYIPQTTLLWRRQPQAKSFNNYGRGYHLNSFWEMLEISFERAESILADYSQFMKSGMINFYRDFVLLNQSNFFKKFILLWKLKLRRKSFFVTLALNILLLTNFKKKTLK